MTRRTCTRTLARAGSIIAAVGLCGAVESFAAAGDLDLSFGGDGQAVTSVGTGGSPGRDVVIQADGKIVVVGSAATFIQPSVAVLTRYNPDGSLDTSFGVGGTGVVTAAVSRMTAATCVALQLDGKIVVGGSVLSGTTDQFLVLRYNTDGSLDTTFDGDGVAITSVLGSNDRVYGIMVQSFDQKIIAVGETDDGTGFPNPTFGNTWAVVRYNPDGSLDTGFDGDGKAVVLGPDTLPGTTVFPSSATSVAQGADGRIVVTGYAYALPQHPSWFVARFNNDGSLDTSFVGDPAVISTPPGVVLTPFSTTFVESGVPADIAVQADGRIVVTGAAGVDVISSVPPYDSVVLVRYNGNGTRDGSFGVDGIVKTSVAPNGARGHSVVIQPTDGKIVVGGVLFPDDPEASADGEVALFRYQVDGSIDPSFGTNGIANPHVLAYRLESGLAIQADRKLVFAGTTSSPDDDVLVMRFMYDPYCAEPTGPCLTAAKSVFKVKHDEDDAKDSLGWKWIKGAALSPLALADPTATSVYVLCMYAGGTLVGESTLPPGAAWKTTKKGYKFKGLAPAGLAKAVLAGDVAHKSKAIVKGKGTKLPDPELPFAEPVVVRLVKYGSPLCLESSFTGADVTRNDTEQFKAKTP